MDSRKKFSADVIIYIVIIIQQCSQVKWSMPDGCLVKLCSVLGNTALPLTERAGHDALVVGFCLFLCLYLLYVAPENIVLFGQSISHAVSQSCKC